MSAQGGAELDRLDEREPEVAELSRRLRAAQRRNNFSGMVAVAIRRATHEGR